MLKMIHKLKKFKSSLTIKNRNHNNSKRSQRISMEIHVIHPLYSGHGNKLIVPRDTYMKLKRNMIIK